MRGVQKVILNKLDEKLLHNFSIRRHDLFYCYTTTKTKKDTIDLNDTQILYQPNILINNFSQQAHQTKISVLFPNAQKFQINSKRGQKTDGLQRY